MEELKHLFEFLYEYDLEIWLLSNNKALKKNPRAFAMIVNGMGLDIDEDKMLYNSKDDKFKTLINNVYFKEIVEQSDISSSEEEKQEKQPE